MAEYTKNEIIISLKNIQSHGELFDINRHISHQFFAPRIDRMISQKSPMDTMVLGLLEQLGIQEGAKFHCRRIFIPAAYAVGGFANNFLLNTISSNYGGFAPIYDMKVIANNSEPKGKVFNIEEMPNLSDWIKPKKVKPLNVKNSEDGSIHTLEVSKSQNELESGRACTYRITFETPVILQEIIDLANDNHPKIKLAERNYIVNLCSNEAWKDYLTVEGSQLPMGLTNGRNAVVAIIDSGIKISGDIEENALPSIIQDRVEPASLRGRLPDDIDTRFAGDEERKLFLDVVHYTLGAENTGGITNRTPELEPALDGEIRDNWPQDELGHGTDVAVIIGEWMAPECSILPIRAFYKAKGRVGGLATIADVCMAIDVAVLAGADVINMSFSVDYPVQMLRDCLVASSPIPGGKKPCFIAALGNHNNNRLSWPAAFATSSDPTIPPAPVLGVGGARYLEGDKFGRGGNTNYGSNYGNYVVAPAQDLETRYSNGEGTSYAAAFVSGLAALIISELVEKDGSDWDRDDVYDIIRQSCRTNGFSMSNGHPWYNVGLINIPKALELV